MKIIHCADIHLGVERGPVDQDTHIPTRILDYLDSLDVVVDFAEEEQVDAFLIAGDVFHTSDPSPMLLSAFASKIKRISKTCPVVILVGNHDTPGPIYKKNSVDIFGELDVSNIYVGDKFETLMLDTKSGPLQVTTFPYPTRHLVGDGKIVSREDYPRIVTELIIAARKSVDISKPAVFLGHFTVSGSVYGSERPMILNTEAEVDIFDLLGWEPGDGPVLSAWNYFALGHIHHHQEVFDEPPVVYAGSLDRVDFGEEHDDKGFVLITIDTADTPKGTFYETSWEFVSVDPRPMVTVRIDARGKKRARSHIRSEISKIDLTDAIARAIIDVDSTTVMPSNEVIEMMYDAGAHWVKGASIHAPVEVTTRLDLDKPLASYAPIELVEIYFDQDDIDDDKYNELLDLAEDLMTSEE